MSWLEPRVSRICRIALAMAVAGLVAGCFEPLYGQRTLAGGPGVGTRLAGVDVAQIRVPNGSPEARIAVEVRNVLIFNLTGGNGGTAPTHTLNIQMTGLSQQVIVDVTTARPDVEQYGINATYSLVELATGKVVMSGQTFSRVSFDNPGQQQRFARARGQRDAENRAAQVIADNIKSRLASYFVAGT
ncbi:MAG: LPS assembly lipoprotein LptE [Pseudomonadota bacterium]